MATREAIETEAELARLRAQVAQLERDRELLNAIANFAPSLLCLINRDGRVRPFATNRAFEQTLGYASEETGGVVFWERFVLPDDAESVREAILQVVGGGAVEEHDARWVKRSGEVVHVLWSCTPLPMFRTGPAWLVFAKDITERKQQEDEVRRSRARIVAAGDDARKRLERNLHDGAQQLLVALLMRLRFARAHDAADPRVVELLDNAIEDLAEAVKELRELARGIHPELLTRRGLGPALRVAAGRLPFPVDVDVPDERWDEGVEAAAYYVVSESLANVVKHAQASRAWVRVRAGDESLLVEVEDDGVGGADASGGTGLSGLADRIAALEGELLFESPSEGGTRVLASIPLG